MDESTNKVLITQFNDSYKMRNKSSQIHIHKSKYNIKTILNYDNKEENKLTLGQYEKYCNYNNYSHRRRKKNIFNMKNNNKTFLTSNADIKTIKNENNFQKNNNQNNIKILKKIFPNIEELNLYSNIPLFPFNKTNNRNKRNKNNLKKEIYDYYYKNKVFITNNFDYNLSQYTLNNKNINNKKIKKSSSTYEKKINNTETTNNKKPSVNIKNYNLHKIHIKEFFRNKEINKYFDIKQNLPNIYKKNENIFKSLKLSKNNNNFHKIKSITISDNQGDKSQNYYKYTEYNNKIESVLSRTKIKSSDEIKNYNYKTYRYVDKATNTNYELLKI